MKKIVIVGAGVAGIAAGIYAQLNGFESVIYEQHTISGGECTAWQRKGYTIDNSISWLTGTKRNTKLYNTWNEVGAFDEHDIVYDEVFAVVKQENQYLKWYRDIDKLEKHLCEISPKDKIAIGELMNILRGLHDFEIPAGKPVDLMNSVEKKDFINRFMRVFGILGSICNLTVEDYVQRFQSELIKNAILSMTFKENLVQGVLITLANIASGQSGWLKGGSRKLTDNMKNKYLRLGGKIYCGQPVQKIIVENGEATGIQLSGGQIIQADYVIPACDLYVTMKKLLGDEYRDSIIDKFYTDRGYRTSSTCQVVIGVDCDLSDYPEKMIYIMNKHTICGETFSNCMFTHYCRESSFAPKGKSVIKTGLTIYNYDNWVGLTEAQYQKQKEEIKGLYLNFLYRYYPETRGKVEMVDITTPLTYERYCGAYKGAYMGFMLTKATNKISHNGIIGNIQKLYIASQWLSALGGLPDALVSGKNAIQRICKAENIRFCGVQ